MTLPLRIAVLACALSATASLAMAQTASIKPTPTPKPKVVTAPAAAPAPAASAAGPAVFPTAVSAKYAKETAGKARMHTCLDQYHANKTTNGNGGMKWIQKGGGYYSACLAKLKG